MYQGFFLVEPGEARSLTGFYDKCGWCVTHSSGRPATASQRLATRRDGWGLHPPRLGSTGGSRTALPDLGGLASLQQVLGLGWAEFRRAYEVGVVADRFDFVIAHNLVNVHSGHDGGRMRTLQPVCLVIDAARGDPYERWLSAAWTSHWERLPAIG